MRMDATVVTNVDYDDFYIEHYGMPRRSGRYPYGSGKDPYQHSRDFLGRVEELKRKGWKETPENIEKEFGINTSQYRIEKTLCNNAIRLRDIKTAERLRDKEGLNNSEIARKMGKPESTIRNYFNNSEKIKTRNNEAFDTADFLKKQIEEKGMIDVGKGVERELGISREKLETALYLLEGAGYPVYNNRFDQVTNPGNKTTQKVLCPKGTEYKDIYDLEKINTIKDYTSHDDGKTFDKKFVYPESMDSKRLKIRYAEEGGIEKDGLIELRRGVEDLSLGESRYAQVRILVDNKKYIKGMAVYSDDLPKGVDVIFNTNKSKNVAKLDVLKDIKDDPDNPFGALIKEGIYDPKSRNYSDGGQSYYYDKNGKKKLSLINKKSGEGDWSDWDDTLPSQFLAKQSLQMAKKQLGLSKADKQEEFDSIMSLTNPTVKKYYLEKFADDCDSAAVNLKAASLPGQKYHVIMPVPSMKDSEVYAPRYENGTKLALIRYPHGGTFEIPILTVNNKQKDAKKLLGSDATDAIGINHKVAEVLSGADFDGDTVMTIPTHDRSGKVKISTQVKFDSKGSIHGLKDLEGFDPKLEYKIPKSDTQTPRMKNTQIQMGVISNLISDMTLMGAPESELARAVKHSMVVIDAEKHGLDYKQSELDNNIAGLHKEYQGKVNGGASTIISKAKSPYDVPKRQGSYKINIKGTDGYDSSKPEGAKIYKTADDLYTPQYEKSPKGTRTLRTIDGDKITYNINDKNAVKKYSPVKKINSDGVVTYTNEDGTIKYAKKTRYQTSTKMAETSDARTLMSKGKYPMEELYADYANTMKNLANKARIEYTKTEKIAYNKKAKEQYAKEVESLNNKLNTALLNTGRERAAQRQANVDIAKKKASNPDMKKGDVTKVGQQALTKYRTEYNSVSRRNRSIEITDKEWEAIQAGAITENKLKQILSNSDADSLRQKAMPRQTNQLSKAKVGVIKAMRDSNYTISEIAKRLGVSESTITKYTK